MVYMGDRGWLTQRLSCDKWATIVVAVSLLLLLTRGRPLNLNSCANSSMPIWQQIHVQLLR